MNGYSGYFPEMNRQLKEILKKFPDITSLTALRSLGVRSVLVDLHSLSDEQVRDLERAVDLQEMKFDQNVMELSVFKLQRTEFQPASKYTGAWRVDLKKEPDSIELTLVATGIGAGFYFVSPGTAPLAWEVRIIGPSGSARTFLCRSSGARLLYGDQNRVSIRIPRPSDPGKYLLELRDLETGRFVTKLDFRL